MQNKLEVEAGQKGKLPPYCTKFKKVIYLSNGCTSEGQNDCKNCKSLNEISGSSLSNLRGFRVCIKKKLIYFCYEGDIKMTKE